ncbi:NUDIX hydrolase [Mycoplana dimorpha]|uniref:NUDIX domain-containing protein n=1 Tax=Mycoplana dimorpha TaxID=28320 RepID=A0A2T5B5B2_MYCDI|nr:NUDIX hydrolase [Mycoplana dimorpha]PTM94178.1 NUDIX domain-containing protein [Mycoplana dimorpha]
MGARKDRRREQEAEGGSVLNQVGALPFRRDKEGNIEIMLITTRQTRRFTLPKGWSMKGKSDRKAARIEAKEEAGVEGTIAGKAVGSYFYWKRTERCFLPIRVTVYLLETRRTLSRWKERRARLRKWLRPAEAALLVDEPELVSLLRQAGEDGLQS